MLAVPLLAVVAIYWSTFKQLITVWDEDPNYSHGFVVPFFALGLAWVAYQRTNLLPAGNTASRSNLIWGSIEIACGLALHIGCIFLGKVGLFLDVAALIFILRGIVLALGGSTANAAYGFPMLFLIFMAPLPAPVYEPIARSLQYVASVTASNMLELTGIAVLREGYVIHVPGHQMEVAGACSGLRSLTAVLALALAIGYLSGRGMPYRWALALLAAPVAVAVNCLRVYGTALIMLTWGPQWATGEAHEREGMVMVGVAALVLVGLAWLLAKGEDWFREEEQPDSPALKEAPAS